MLYELRSDERTFAIRPYAFALLLPIGFECARVVWSVGNAFLAANKLPPASAIML